VPTSDPAKRGLTVDLAGAVAVVIGAGEGIGQAIAVAFAESGATVVAASRNVHHLDTTRELADAAPGRVHVERVEVREPAGVAAFAGAVAERYGSPTVLVNSAGAHLPKPALEVTADEWDLVHDVQLRGTFFACQAFARHMATSGYGKIINLSSTWAATVAPGRSVYCAAKAGVSHLTAALAQEWAPLGIRVNAVAPTATKTPAAVARLAADPEREARTARQIPLGRWAVPADVVGSALFLASPASDFVTGHVLFVDGGWRASK
jgi:NAD(P)-dependent dehydrogenase (short-subunit alcohol dehydrogenase family)